LASRFDFVIAAASAKDTSAATLASLGLASDGVVLVVDGARTRRNDATTLLTRLRDTGVVVFGAVYTKRKATTAAQNRSALALAEESA